MKGSLKIPLTFSGFGRWSLLLLVALLSFVRGASAATPTTFNYTGTVQTYTVPTGVTAIDIDAAGAQGGGGGTGGGKGARMQGTFTVTPGTVLNIVVGQQGLLQVGGNAQNSSGGGGGTFVFVDAQNLLVAAGGGGGKCNYTSSAPIGTGSDGLATTDGGSSSGAGGTNGAGGGAGTFQDVPCAGGGTGWLSNGGGPYGGLGFNTWTGGPGFGGGGGGGAGGVGGFGGGGGGGTDPTHGAGGGSFNGGASQTNTSGFQTGDGYVTITESTPVVVIGSFGVYPNPSFVDVSNAFTISVTPPELTITWDFGDGTTGTGATPKHIYSAPGTYTVKATVSGSGDPIEQTLTLPVTQLQFGNSGTLPATQSLSITYGRIRSVKNQCLQLQGFIPINNNTTVQTRKSGGITFTGIPVKLSVNGLTRSFTLNKQGHAVITDSRFGVKLSPTYPNFAKFELYSNPKTLNKELATNVGLDTQGRPKIVDIVLTIDGQTYSSVIPLNYLPAVDPGYVLFGLPLKTYK